MTVKELIEELKKLPLEAQSMEVWHEGCDCLGKAESVKLDRNGDCVFVLITRE